MIFVTFFTKEYQWLAYFGTIISTIVACYVLILLIKRNQEKPSKILRNLIISMGFLGSAALLDFIFFTIAGLKNELRETDFLAYGSYLSFTFNAIANIFLLFFALEVFHEKENNKKWYLIYLLEIILGPALFLSFVYRYDILPFFLIHVLSSFIIYVVLTKDALNLRKKLLENEPDDTVSHKSLMYIALSGILLFIAVAMFILHEVFIILEISEYVTVALGWVLGSFAAYSVYLGYVVPDWVKERWTKK